MGTSELRQTSVPLPTTTGPGADGEIARPASTQTTQVALAGLQTPVPDTYRLREAVARAPADQAILDLGLTMPELSEAQQAIINRMPPAVPGKIAELGQEVAGLVATGTNPPATSQLQGRWAEFVSGLNLSGGMDVTAMVQAVLREAYMENTKDLHFYAQKVRFFNELKKKIRDELTSARKFLAQYAGADSNAAVNWGGYTNSQETTGALQFSNTPVLDENGNLVPADPEAASVAGTKEGLETYIKNLEEQLNSVGDDAQLANVDLQNMLQKQQQTLQTMSNISKMLHDTAMAIIRKISG